MPTGYASIIDDNPDVTFDQYVWRCARAFGALYSSIPAWRLESLTKAEARLRELQEMTLNQAKALSEVEHEQLKERIRKDNADEAAITHRYTEMERQVRAWEPPTADHAKLQTFMLEQLWVSRPDYCRKQLDVPTLDPPETWLKERIREAQRNVAHCRKDWEMEQKRVNDSNAWLDALRESVPVP